MERLPRVIVGLGNPTSSYDKTRHNIGKRFVESLADRSDIDPLPLKSCILPSFMNESGPALRSFLQKKGVPIEETLVVVDDFMIPFGELRLKTKGSSGGHNGLKSIIETFGTDEFPRLRVGIGPVPSPQDPADFVLKRFTKEEEGAFPQIFDRIHDGLRVLFSDGYQKAMTSLNK